jgi:DNA-binding NarL/FixJ family response regulator
LEITLKSGNGLELIKALAVQHPRLPVLVLSMHEESLYAELALRSGATGYVMKTEGIETVLVAIRRVLSGKLYLSEAVTSEMLRQQIHGRTAVTSSPMELLTDRELQVFQSIGEWHRTKEIATELHLSVKTVEYHREKIREKLHLKDASELVHFATQCATAGLALSPNPATVTPPGPPLASA